MASKNKSIITKEMILRLYNEEQLRLKDICKELHIGMHHLKELMELYEIPFKSPSQIKSQQLIKTQQTSLTKYGTMYPNQAEEVKNKIKASTSTHYGVTCSLASQEIRDKMKQTWINKYGVDNPMKVPEIQSKTRDTCLERYGVSYIGQSLEVKNKVKQTCMDRYGVPSYSQTSEFIYKYSSTCNNKYGVPYYCLRPECFDHTNGKESSYNEAFASRLTSQGLKYEREFQIKNYRYDFKVGNNLIEINPSYTHNSTCGYRNNKPLTRDYHASKMLVGCEAGFRVLSIFDWDDLSKIVQLLKKSTCVGARSCEIKEVNNGEAKNFLVEHHLQSYIKSQVNLGLYYKGQLVSLMTFGKPRYNKNYQWELLRYCSCINVTGGAQRLWNHFIRMYDPESIISYCDLSKFSGNLYKKLGMDLIRISIGKHWYNIKTDVHITDNLLRAQGFDRLFKTNYGKGSSNEQLMLGAGFVEIYDCGQATYGIKLK